MPNIILLVRSYNRLNYLQATIQSLLNSDIDICTKRYIYDDCSDNDVINFLKNDSSINVKNKEFNVIFNNKNYGCKDSYSNALSFIKQNNKDCDFICTIDNDVEVTNNFISKLFEEYKKASSLFNTNNILFTGFNPSNTHNNIIRDYGTFYTKYTCGGVNFFFNISFTDFIIDNWNINLDWGVCDGIKNNNYYLCCTKTSCLNHIGRVGLNSSFNNFDIDNTFKNRLIIKYGTTITNNTDVTDICYNKLNNNNIITIPSGDHPRAHHFGDPSFGFIKKIFIIDNNNNIFEYNQNSIIKIDTLNKNINIYCKN